jgi:2'-5' RNA ligase
MRTPFRVEDAAMSDVWRLFAAIEVPQDVRERVGQAGRLLADAGWRAKWVTPDRTHLTLKFYGNVELERLDVLQQALREAIERESAFTLQAAGAGVFPNPRRPRVLWLGLGGHELQFLNRLQAGIDQASADLGFPPEERAFHPHLTVARIKPEDLSTITGVERRLAELSAFPALPVPVERVTLFRSELRRSGPIYTRLEEFPLNGVGR